MASNTFLSGGRIIAFTDQFTQSVYISEVFCVVFSTEDERALHTCKLSYKQDILKHEASSSKVRTRCQLFGVMMEIRNDSRTTVDVVKKKRKRNKICLIIQIR